MGRCDGTLPTELHQLQILRVACLDHRMARTEEVVGSLSHNDTQTKVTGQSHTQQLVRIDSYRDEGYEGQQSGQPFNLLWHHWSMLQLLQMRDLAQPHCPHLSV